MDHKEVESTSESTAARNEEFNYEIEQEWTEIRTNSNKGKNTIGVMGKHREEMIQYTPETTEVIQQVVSLRENPLAIFNY